MTTHCLKINLIIDPIVASKKMFFPDSMTGLSEEQMMSQRSKRELLEEIQPSITGVYAHISRRSSKANRKVRVIGS
jgi:hypothetical protein